MLWASYDLTSNIAKTLDGDWLCEFVFFTTLPMYKPVALAMWAALLPVLAHVYYVGQARRRARSPPRDVIS